MKTSGSESEDGVGDSDTSAHGSDASEEGNGEDFQNIDMV